MNEKVSVESPSEASLRLVNLTPALVRADDAKRTRAKRRRRVVVVVVVVVDVGFGVARGVGETRAAAPTRIANVGGTACRLAVRAR
jgi:hypothetical protein